MCNVTAIIADHNVQIVHGERDVRLLCPTLKAQLTYVMWTKTTKYRDILDAEGLHDRASRTLEHKAQCAT